MRNFFNISESANRASNQVTVDNQAVQQFANAWIGLAKMKVRFKTIAGKASVKITAEFTNRKEIVTTYADETLLEMVVNALHGKLNVEDYLKEGHTALEIENLEMEMFKQDILSGRKLTFLSDFKTDETSYLHAVSQFYRGEINYYIKRTEELEAFLQENNLVTKVIAA